MKAHILDLKSSTELWNFEFEKRDFNSFNLKVKQDLFWRTNFNSNRNWFVLGRPFMEVVSIHIRDFAILVISSGYGSEKCITFQIFMSPHQKCNITLHTFYIKWIGAGKEDALKKCSLINWGHTSLWRAMMEHTNVKFGPVVWKLHDIQRLFSMW